VRTPLPHAARVTLASRALFRAGRDRLMRAGRDVERLRSTLALLDPEAVLERGYAIVTAQSGEVVSDARQVRVADRVGLRFAKGAATATVTAVESDE